MLLKKYNDFMIDKLLLESLNEFKFILSGRLKNILKNINSEISDALLALHNDDDYKSKKTFIDINERDDETLTLIQANKATEILKIDNQEYLDNNPYSIQRYKKLKSDHDVYNKHRISVRVGRLINYLFPNRFPSASPTDITKKSKDIENFVRMYKSIVFQNERFKLLDLVNGDNISYWYDCNNYDSSDSGSLGSSCMASVYEEYFEIYVNNPNTIQLLILYSDNSKSYISGRALVWTLYEPENGRKYMDRIYTNDSSDEQVFIDYAKENGWLFRSSQGWNNTDIVDSLTNQTINTNLMVRTTKDDYSYYPWMDTMCYYSPELGILSNKSNNLRLYLQSQDGSSSTNSDYYENEDDTYIFSKYEGEDILRRTAVYCYYGDDWVHTSVAKRVFNAGLVTNPDGTNRIYSIPVHPDVVRSYIPDINYDKHFPKKKCIWSIYLNAWIFKDSKVKIYLDVNREKFGYDHKKRKDINFGKVGRVHYVIELLEKNENDQWKLKKENEKV